jgi:hypothetical protein
LNIFAPLSTIRRDVSRSAQRYSRIQNEETGEFSTHL